MLDLNPFTAIGEFILGAVRAGKVSGWARLIFSMLASFFLTFSTICGSALVAGSGWAFSVGAGMVSGAAMAFLAFLRADKKLTQGVVIAVPQRTVEAQFDAQGRGPMVTEPKR